MTLKSLSLALATTALAVLAHPVLAQDPSDATIGTPAKEAVAGGPTRMGLAQQIYALGVAQGDAVIVLAAARLAASVAVADMTPARLDLPAEGITVFRPPVLGRAISAGAVISLGTVGTAVAEDAEGAAPVTAEAMFAKASELAGDDAAVLALIEDAQAESSRGRVGEVVRLESRLPAGMTDVWEIPFQGNSLAELAILGDGVSNLDVSISDENGDAVCHQVGLSDTLYCDWLPARDGYFYVTVQNTGDAQSRYQLLTN